jgi:CSLREA domain-containing protein
VAGPLSHRRILVPAVSVASALALMGLGTTPALAASSRPAAATTVGSKGHAPTVLAGHAPALRSKAAVHAPPARGERAHPAKVARPMLRRAPRLSPATTTPPAFVYTVNTTADTVDANPGDNVCADSTAKCSLRAAVMEADVDTGLVRIILPAGTYALGLVAATPDDASTGDLNLTNLVGGIEIVGAGAGSTTVDASGVNDRVFEVGSNSGAVTTASISGITIRGGNTQDGNSAVAGTGDEGGGVLVNQTGALTLSHDTITDDIAQGNNNNQGGGGIFNAGTLWLAASTVSSDSAVSGGGLYNGNLASINTTTFTADSADDGGGVYTNYPLTMTNSVLSHNQAAGDGGGILAGDVTDLATVDLTDNTAANGAGGFFNFPVVWDGGTASGNTATSNGGGVYVNFDSDLTDVAVTANTAGAAGDGGGIYNDQTLEFTGGRINANSAQNGGGLYNNGSGTLTDTQVNSNQSLGTDENNYGGGIDSEGSLSLLSVVVDANSGAYQGGGIYDAYSLTGTGVTLSANSASYGAGLYVTNYGSLVASSITGNAAGVQGGGVYNGSTVGLKAVVVNGNSAVQAGGGIYNNSYLTDNLGTINANTTTTGGEGGGLYNNNEAALDQLTLTGNAASAGGAIYNQSAIQVDGSTLNANLATKGSGGDGGAIYTAYTAQLTDDTLTQNVASAYGGAIDNAGAEVSITETTINANTADDAGGGLAAPGASSATVFHSSVLTANVAGGTYNNCDVAGTVAALYSLDSQNSCGFVGTGDITGRLGKLAPLANYGGATETERLNLGSPAINSAGAACATATDQRGITRPQLGACDMGAVEVTVLQTTT